MDEQAAAAQQEHIRRYISQPVGVGSGHARLFWTMGDRVAIGIARALYPSRVADGHLLRKILFALRSAFSASQLVEDLADRIPAVTLVLLDALASSVRSQEESEAIAATIAEIKLLTAVTREEAL